MELSWTKLTLPDLTSEAFAPQLDCWSAAPGICILAASTALLACSIGDHSQVRSPASCRWIYYDGASAISGPGWSVDWTGRCLRNQTFSERPYRLASVAGASFVYISSIVLWSFASISCLLWSISSILRSQSPGRRSSLWRSSSFAARPSSWKT